MALASASAAAAMAAAQTPVETATRIHVGGLGQSVSSDDLRRLFSLVGTVEGLDIVRTKGRSFAYVDILPSSSNSLCKLFSTYNGCVWKGGKLKLEKAKEHYLIQLKREWAEKEEKQAAEVADHQPLPSSPLDRLRIFFPGLSKVKSLPFSGTGKHKYSFQRVETPALPLHFCDCEEHSGHFNIPKTKKVHLHEERNGGMNEEEVSMMSLVMHKLFERGNISNTCRGEVTLERDNGVKPIEDTLLDEEEEEDDDNDDDDDDDLIINVVSNSNNRAAIPGRREQKIISNEKTSNAETQVTIDGAHQSMPNVKKKIDLHPRKKRKPLPNKVEFKETVSVLPVQGRNSEFNESESDSEDEADEDDITINAVSVANNRMFSSERTKLSKKFKSSDQRVQNKDHLLPNKKMNSIFAEESNKNEVVPTFNEEKGNFQTQTNGSIIDAQSTAPECGLKQSATSRSWSQKSSWRALVGDRSNSTFSLSNILQNVEATNEEKQNSNSTEVGNDPNNGNENFATPNNMEGVFGKTEMMDVLAEVQPNQPNTFSSNSGRGSSWLHKSSWVQLVSDNKNSFSISQILSPATNAKLDVTKTACEDVGNYADGNHNNIMKLHKRESKVKALGAGNEGDSVQSILESTQQTVGGAAVPAVENTFNSDSNKARGGNATSIGETCSFMRSSASLEEWAKTKAILRGTRKKKR